MPTHLTPSRKLPPGPIVQCALNVSEGIGQDVLAALREAASCDPAVTLAGVHSDPDHNRSVLSLLGPPERLPAVVCAIARVAIDRIDLRQHSGEHPRIGAIDVVPFSPIREVSLADCADLGRTVGRLLAERFEVPVFLYEASRTPGRAALLPAIRTGGFERLAQTALSPDFGPSAVHPTAGAVVVGGRNPLVAFNVNLNTASPDCAKRIARDIRTSRGQNPVLSGVRALGIALESRQLSQVSLNLTRPFDTDLVQVFDFVCTQAALLGVQALQSEVIGLVPAAAAGARDSSDFGCPGLLNSQWIETWVRNADYGNTSPQSEQQ